MAATSSIVRICTVGPQSIFSIFRPCYGRLLSLRGTMADISGWVVEAIVPAVGTTLVRRRYLFAVSSDNASEAERLVRQRLGSLHCAIAVRLRLEPRAIADLQMGSNPIKELAR